MMGYLYSMVAIFCLTAEMLGQTIINPPSPSTGILAGTAILRCEIEFTGSEYMEWYFENDIIYYYENGDEKYPTDNPRYSVELEGKVFTLTVSELQFEDGGRYGCKVNRAPIKYVALLVLGTPSVKQETSNTVENSNAVISCEAYFGGPARASIEPDHYPELKMLFRGNQLEGIVNEKPPEEPVIYYNFSMVYNITLQAEMDGEDITCEISTANPEAYVTGSHAMEVLYSARSIAYLPKQETYNIGNSIRCTADGNPEPSFEWRNMERDESSTIPSNNLTIIEEMIGANTWECQANNTVDGTLHSAAIRAEFTVLEDTEKGPIPGGDSWKIGVGVAVPVCVLIIGTILILVLKWKLPSKNTPQSVVVQEGNPGHHQNDAYSGSKETLNRKISTEPSDGSNQHHLAKETGQPSRINEQTKSHDDSSIELDELGENGEDTIIPREENVEDTLSPAPEPPSFHPAWI